MTFLLAALTILFSGALASLLTGRHSRWATGCGIAAAIAAALLTTTAALEILLSGVTETYHGTWLVPAGAFLLRIDPLAACFLLPIAVLTPLAAIYACAYLRKDAATRSLAPHWCFYSLLTAALILVVTAAHALLFIMAWELMTLSSYFLVAHEDQDATVRKAAWFYLIAAHFGLLFILAFFLYAGSHCGGLAFSDFAPLAQLPPGTATVLFVLALVGFGVKAGLFPLHIWLPNAHPAAPSHVSAIMSGVVVKSGLYGLLRALTFLPKAPAFWGMILLALGMCGALYGIAMATQQQDIKRCLAYSTIENVGIILCGFGLGLVATAQGLPLIAALAYGGALLHLWNHTLFKGLLFLGAGSLYHATGTRNLDRMGGLLRRTPTTGLLLLGGCVAICALPPLNGFAGEWLIYLGLLRSASAFSGIGALGIGLLLALLGLVGALAVVTFTRLAGIALLGEPRSPEAAAAHEAERALLWPMRLLFGVCLFIGLQPQQALHLLAPVLTQLTPVPIAEFTQALAPLSQIGLWALGLILLIGLLWALTAWLLRRRPQAAAATWGCGFSAPTSRMAYTAEGYGEFVRNHLLPAALRPAVDCAPPRHLFPQPTRLTQVSEEVILQRLYLPIFTALADRCVRLHWLQQGKQHLYLLYIFTCCAFLMLWSVLDGKGIW